LQHDMAFSSQRCVSILSHPIGASQRAHWV
jgi:hypothetical protein